MKTENEWLQTFKTNLKDSLLETKLDVRRDMIIWELSWIDARLKEIEAIK